MPVFQFHVYPLRLNVKCVSSSSCFQPGEGPCGGLLRDCTTLGCTKVGMFLMFPTAQLGCKCIKPLPGSNNTQTFHIRTIWTDCTPPTIITCREADSYSLSLNVIIEYMRFAVSSLIKTFWSGRVWLSPDCFD